ncbi:hypothetical protein M3Y98_00633000 [Aphelenchoides besseyi]|nr:hypothetical protein M3Y98_00633000 [Aphelenchoides besseyi]
MDVEIRTPEEEDGNELGTRNRLVSCGIQQLDALRLKHKLLMEQLRRDYPSMNSLIRDLAGDESSEDTITGECVSGSSETPSHRTSTSADSGYAPEKPEQPIPYSTFRKLSLEENYKSGRKNATSSAHIVEATLKSLTTANKREEPSNNGAFANTSTTSRSWSRLRKAGRGLADRPRSCYGSTATSDMENGGRPASLIVSNGHTAHFLDSAAFAKLTPPQLQRKFNSEQPNGYMKAKIESPPLVHVRPLPQREQSTLIGRPNRTTANNPHTVQRAQLRQLVSPPVLTRKISSTHSTTIDPHSQPPLQGWQSAAAKQIRNANRLNDTKTETRHLSPVRSTVFQNELQSPRLNRIIAPVAPMRQNATTRWSDCSTTFPSALARKSTPMIGTATISKVPQTHQPPTFTSTCSIALTTPPKSPIVTNRRTRPWHNSEKL